MKLPKGLIANLHSFQAQKLFADLNFSLYSHPSIMDHLFMHALIYGSNYAIQSVMELNLLHLVVQRDLELTNEDAHFTTHASLPTLVLLYLFKVALSVFIIEQVSFPLGVVGKNTELVQIKANVLNFLATLKHIEFFNYEIHDKVL